MLSIDNEIYHKNIQLPQGNLHELTLLKCIKTCNVIFSCQYQNSLTSFVWRISTRKTQPYLAHRNNKVNGVYSMCLMQLSHLCSYPFLYLLFCNIILKVNARKVLPCMVVLACNFDCNNCTSEQWVIFSRWYSFWIHLINWNDTTILDKEFKTSIWMTRYFVKLCLWTLNIIMYYVFC